MPCLKRYTMRELNKDSPRHTYWKVIVCFLESSFDTEFLRLQLEHTLFLGIQLSTLLNGQNFQSMTFPWCIKVAKISALHISVQRKWKFKSDK